MQFLAIHRRRLTAAAVIFAGAAAVMGVLTPAFSDEVQSAMRAFSIISCTGSSPCEEGKNGGKGPGLEGISAKGNGVVGQTNNTAGSQSGVLGQDKSTTSGQNAGVTGTSTEGFGVVGSSTDGPGVEGKSTNSVGVSGIGLGAGVPGVSGFSSSGTGVEASSTGGDALHATTAGALSIAVEAISEAGMGVHVLGGSTAGPELFPALSVNGNGQNPDLIYACANGMQDPCTSGGGHPAPQFVAVNNGNVFITGQIFTAGPCSSGCASSPSRGEQRVRLFTPQESLPTVEDFGEAQLVGGRASVRIDPNFAKTMDSHAAYLVFITPEGDSNGLYVIDKTTSGFDVRENKGGRSTLTFSYRIVAKPFGRHDARLQMITVTRPGMSLPTTSRIP